jgi:hypothetical protein
VAATVSRRRGVVECHGVNEGDFLDKINEALKQCQWLVLVLTPNAIASKWVKIEVNAAINCREKGLTRGVLPILASQIPHDTIPPIWDMRRTVFHSGDFTHVSDGTCRLHPQLARAVVAACSVPQSLLIGHAAYLAPLLHAERPAKDVTVSSTH